MVPQIPGSAPDYVHETIWELTTGYLLYRVQYGHETEKNDDKSDVILFKKDLIINILPSRRKTTLLNSHNFGLFTITAGLEFKVG